MVRFWKCALLAVVLVLSACATTTPQAQRAADEAECASYGFRGGTDAFAQCLLQLELDRRAARRARGAELRGLSDPLVVYRPVPVRIRTQ